MPATTTFADPASVAPHAVVRGIAPGVCTTCGHLVRIGHDPVHSVNGTCERCAGQTRPLSTLCDLCHEALRAESDQARQARLVSYGGRKPEPTFVDDLDEPERASGAPSAVDPEKKRRHAAAVEYVRAYRGSWGLPLDIKADPKWATKHHRLSERQVDVLLQGRDRDLARASAASDPRQVAARTWLKANPPRGEGFLASMHDRAVNGLSFSDKQLEIVERIIAERSPSGAALLATGAGDVRRTVVEGWYVVDGIVWKVQRAVNGSGNLYGKQLVIDEGQSTGHWDYVPGGLKVIAERGEALSVEQAAAFGKLYGVCAVCGRTLTDETSIAAGLGPICGGRLRKQHEG